MITEINQPNIQTSIRVYNQDQSTPDQYMLVIFKTVWLLDFTIPPFSHIAQFEHNNRKLTQFCPQKRENLRDNYQVRPLKRIILPFYAG